MSLNQFLLDVGAQLQDFLWRDAPVQPSSAELDLLEKRVRQESAHLAQLLTQINKARARQADQERQQAWLSSRIEVYHHVGDRANAWKHALELDRLRRALEGEQRQLRQLRQAYRQQYARLECLQGRLASLQRQFASSDEAS
jgi:hypothetical protein